MDIIPQMDLFGNTLQRKQPISRPELAEMLYQSLYNMSLTKFASLFTNEFQELIAYVELSNGFKSGQNISLLFNPQRLDTVTHKHPLSIYKAFTQNRNFCDGLARVILLKKGKVKVSELLNQSVQMGINSTQYVNEFPPHLARDLYVKYCRQGAESRILDPCAGWGGRMLGASIVSNHYDCFDPATKTVEGLKKLSDFINKLNPDFTPIITCMPYEDADVKENFYDFALTSPPYYDTEHYSDEDTNSLVRYKTFDSWCEGFYLPFIEKTMRALKQGSFFVLNIGSRRYPLNDVMITNFKDTCDIQKSGKYLAQRPNNDDEVEGETFYSLRKK